MKILLTILISLFALSAQAQTTFEHFTADDEWPALSEFGNIIVPGEFFCTGGSVLRRERSSRTAKVSTSGARR